MKSIEEKYQTPSVISNLFKNLSNCEILEFKETSSIGRYTEITFVEACLYTELLAISVKKYFFPTEKLFLNF